MPPPTPQWIAIPTKSVCALRTSAGSLGGAGGVVLRVASVFEASASFHAAEPAPNTFVMSPFGPVPVFSSTTFASAVAPQSQPARVYGTHGAGVFFGVPLSPFTITGVGSLGGRLMSSVKSVQYLNDDDDAVVPSDLKYRNEFETAWPWRSEYMPVSDVRIPFAVCEMRTLWSFVSRAPMLRMKFSRFGICSRSDGTFGLSRRKCTLSKIVKTTCLIFPLCEFS